MQQVDKDLQQLERQHQLVQQRINRIDRSKQSIVREGHTPPSADKRRRRQSRQYKRNPNRNTHRDSRYRQEHEQKHEIPKRRKLSSVVGVVNVAQTEIEKPMIAARPTRRRNLLFGKLLKGTLEQAKEQLSEARQKKMIEKRESTEKKIMERLKKTSEDLKCQKIENLNEMKTKEVLLREKLLIQMKIKRIEQTCMTLKQSGAAQRRYVKTSNFPPILWAPTKSFRGFDEMLEESAERIQEDITGLLEELDEQQGDLEAKLAELAARENKERIHLKDGIDENVLQNGDMNKSIDRISESNNNEDDDIADDENEKREVGDIQKSGKDNDCDVSSKSVDEEEGSCATISATKAECDRD